MFKRTLTLGLLGLAATLPNLALAQALHEGDIELAVEAGKVVTDGAAHFHGIDGLAIFEGDFGDLSGGPYLTDDPGFDSAVGTFAPGTLVTYLALDTLQFWNGSTWSASVPSQEYVRLDGNLGEETRWTATGISGDTTGLIGQAGTSDGKVHEHLDFRVVGSGTPTIGAYLVKLQVQANGYTSSDPFYMVFNRGLTETAFESSVTQLASPVPEPASWALLAAGLAAAATVSRRRTA